MNVTTYLESVVDTDAMESLPGIIGGALVEVEIGANFLVLLLQIAAVWIVAHAGHNSCTRTMYEDCGQQQSKNEAL